MKKLLLVEDEDLIRESLGMLLEKILKGQLTVDYAENGQVALEKTKVTDYDIIITDLNMPVMDGVQFLQQYSKMGKDAYVMIHSAYFSNFDVDKSLYKEFLTKPYNTRDMAAKISEIING